MLSIYRTLRRQGKERRKLASQVALARAIRLLPTLDTRYLAVAMMYRRH